MNQWALVFLLFFFVLVIFDLWYSKQNKKRELRRIQTFENLSSALEASVEDGSRIHFSIGRSEVTSPEIAAGLIGLHLLKRVSHITSDSDLPPISSAGTGSLMVLSQDTIRTIYNNIGQQEENSNHVGRFTGATPFSYAAASALEITDQKISTNLMIGSFGIEAGLITHSGEQSNTLTIAGTDDMLGQAVLYATAHETLIGEEIFASGAYFDSKDIHFASIRAQDIIRLIIILGISSASIYGLIKGLL